MDIKDIFKDNSFKKTTIKRVIASDDPSFAPFIGARIANVHPSTENYAPSSTHRPTEPTPVSTPMSAASDPKEELAEKAQQSLQEALDHCNKDVVIKNALEAILETYDAKIEDYSDNHPLPDQKPELLQDPAWSRVSKSNRAPIPRVGSAPKEENPIVQEVGYIVKALNGGASLSEIQEVDSVFNRYFSFSNGNANCSNPGKGGFRKKFAAAPGGGHGMPAPGGAGPIAAPGTSTPTVDSSGSTSSAVNIDQEDVKDIDDASWKNLSPGDRYKKISVLLKKNGFQFKHEELLEDCNNSNNSYSWLITKYSTAGFFNKVMKYANDFISALGRDITSENGRPSKRI